MAELADALDLGSSSHECTFKSCRAHQQYDFFPRKLDCSSTKKTEGFYMKRRPSDWLKWVKMHVEDGVPMTYLARDMKTLSGFEKVYISG